MKISKEEEKTISGLRKFFAVSVAVFEMQNSIYKAFGYSGAKSYMHILHLKAKEEIDKEVPNLKKMDTFLAMMEDASKEFSKPRPKFEKGIIRDD
tara:strand:+ start:296 stop:580 length:285 start_codon:yes stop_codon:yes gene_type:complete